ncbi:MAG: hypothetical protein RIS99_371 [Bacteroidota bacterium]
MKAPLFLFLLGMLFFQPGKSQPWRISVGLNRSQVTWSDSENTRRLIAPVTGLHYQKSYGKSGFELGMNLSFRGGDDLNTSTQFRSIRSDFRGVGTFQLNSEISIFGGVQYSNAIRTYRILMGDTLAPNSDFKHVAFNNLWEPIAGLEVAFSPKVALQVQHSFASQIPGYTNTQFSFCITPDFRPKKEKIKPLPTPDQNMAQKLQSGFLLVRLPMMSLQLKALEKSGSKAQIDTFQARRTRTHEAIKKAFTDSFSFCPTFFFLGDQNDNVYQGNLNGIIFGNTGAPALTRPDGSFYLIADFGSIEPDSAYNFRKGRYEYAGVLDGKMGLMLRDSKGNQLKAPFPFYVLRVYQSEGKSLSKALANEESSLWIGDDWNYNAMAKKLAYKLKIEMESVK